MNALIKTEEGEKRAYKIDFSDLQVTHQLGEGSFGIVYRGEYRGADVAVKKLKYQKVALPLPLFVCCYYLCCFVFFFLHVSGLYYSPCSPSSSHIIHKMSKQQMDEFSQESAVMVGLRHPSIPPCSLSFPFLSFSFPLHHLLLLLLL